MYIVHTHNITQCMYIALPSSTYSLRMCPEATLCFSVDRALSTEEYQAKKDCLPHWTQLFPGMLHMIVSKHWWLASGSYVVFHIFFSLISHNQIVRFPATLGAPRKGCLKALRAPNALSRAAGYVGARVQQRVDLKGGKSKVAWTRL